MSTLTTVKIKALVRSLRFPNKPGMTDLLKAVDKAIDAKKGDAVPNLAITIAATPTQAQVQSVANKVDALLTSLRAAGIIS